MAIRAEDIPKLGADAQRQILEKMGQQTHTGKYHAQKDKRGSITFDSKKEARRYDDLMFLLRIGAISDLRLQPQFTLQEAYTTPEGMRIRAIRYVADFSYRTPDGKMIVEDVKSPATKTRVYEVKRKLMQERFGIEVREVWEV